MLAPAIDAATMKRARVIRSSRGVNDWCAARALRIIANLHFAVPVLRFGVHRSEDFHVPLAASPRLDDLRGHDVDQNLREEAPFRVALEMIGRLVPPEARIEHQREEQIV